MCVLVISCRAVQQRAPLKQNVKNEALFTVEPTWYFE